MSLSPKKVPYFKTLSELESSPGFWMFLLGLLIAVTAFSVAYYNYMLHLGLLAVMAIPVVYAMLYNPRIWIYIMVISLPIFLRTDEEGVDAADIIQAAFHMGTLLIWLITRALNHNYKLVTRSYEWLLFAFYALLLVNFFIAKFNGVPTLEWFRDFFLICLTLYYFPIKVYFSKKKHFDRLMFFFGLTAIALSFSQFYLYYQLLSDITYAYEFGISIRKNQIFFTIAATMGLTYFFHLKKFKYRLFAFFMTVVTTGALISTFSRTFWLILLASGFLIFLYLPFRQKIQFSVTSLSALAILVGSVFIFSPTNANLFVKYVEKRFTSSTEGKQDISVRARLDEYDYTLKLVKEYPLGGNGLGKEYSYYSILSQYNWVSSYIHNGFISVAYRVGIPMFIMYMSIYFIATYKAFLVFLNSRQHFSRLISVAAIVTMFIHFVSNITSTQFFTRDGVFMVAFSFFLCYFAEELYAEEKKSKQVNADIATT